MVLAGVYTIDNAEKCQALWGHPSEPQMGVPGGRLRNRLRGYFDAANRPRPAAVTLPFRLPRRGRIPAGPGFQQHGFFGGRPGIHLGHVRPLVQRGRRLRVGLRLSIGEPFPVIGILHVVTAAPGSPGMHVDAKRMPVAVDRRPCAPGQFLAADRQFIEAIQ
jgi:hypothetical protein